MKVAHVNKRWTKDASHLEHEYEGDPLVEAGVGRVGGRGRAVVEVEGGGGAAALQRQLGVHHAADVTLGWKH